MTATQIVEPGRIRLEKDGAVGWIVMDHPAFREKRKPEFKGR